MLQTIKFILNHPLNKRGKFKALIRFLLWQLNTKINPYPIVYPFTENSKLIVWKGLTGATGNLYCGLHEFEDMSFLLHVLRPEDKFADIGANIGSYTMLAAVEVGAQTLSIEPVPQTFRYLSNNIAINAVETNVKALNLALGGKKGTLKFTKSLDTVNHVATEDEIDTIDVPIDTLDNITTDFTPLLMKIDVEGFEIEVLRGAKELLKNKTLEAIIIELNGSGKRYGFEDDDVHETLLEAGFRPYIYKPFERKLISIEQYGIHNTIYVRNLQAIQKRIFASKNINIRGLSY